MKMFKIAFLIGCKSSRKKIKNPKNYVEKKINKMKNKDNYNIVNFYEIGKTVSLIAKG